MLQFIFIALFVMTVLAGAFSYFSPQKSVSPMQFMMDKSGYSEEQLSTRKRIQQVNMTISQGLMQIRNQMDTLALQQSKFLHTLNDQQHVLNNAGKEAEDIMLLAKQQGQASDKDILQLKTLASQIQNEQSLLISHGQDLVVLNDQLTTSRQAIADQIDLANINTENDLNTLKQRFDSLNNQASEVFEKVTERNQQIRDQMDDMQNKLNGIAIACNNSRLQQDRNRILLQENQEKQADAKEQLNDKLQQNRDMMDQERQKQEDQQIMVQQRIADQEQRIQDQRNP